MSDIADDELLARLRHPDTASFAFNQLVRKYQQQVYRIVRRILIDHDESNDVVQEIFVKVWRSLDTFRADAKLSTWLYRIATNETLSHLRKKRRRYFLPLHDVEGELHAKLDSGLLLDGDAIQLKLQHAILTLPERQRMVFHMRYFDDMSYEDMAQVLGLTEGALKASYHHATKKIEAYFAKH